MILQINILDNGSSAFLNRTCDSIKNQITEQVSWEILDCTAFWKPNRNLLYKDADYVLFLYSGSVLEENAVEQICDKLEKSKPVWLYFDEQTFDAKINGEPFGFLEKPDFDIFSFVRNVYTGEGVVFSRQCLEQMELRYEGSSFGAALTEMSIAAAMQAEPLHLKENLLIRHLRYPLNEADFRLMTDFLNQYLGTYTDNLVGVPKADTVGLHIFPVRQTGAISVILLSDAELPVEVSSYHGMSKNIEVISVGGDLPYWERCMIGAGRASHDVLCFVAVDQVQCFETQLMSLYEHICLPDVGIVSPCIVGDNSILYAGNYGAEGNPFAVFRNQENTKLLMDEIQGIRQTALPAWQCWMIRKGLFQKTAEIVRDSADVEKYPKNYFMLECARHLRLQGKKNLYVGSVAVNGQQVQEETDSGGFCSMLIHHRETFFRDPFCPAGLGTCIRQDEKRHFKAYLPEHMQVCSPETRKVLVLSHELSLTGAPIVLRHAVHILREENFQIVVMCPVDGPLRKAFLLENVPVIIRDDLDESDEWLRWADEFDLILVNTVVPFRQIQQLGNIQKPVMWWLHDAKSGYQDYLRHVLPDTISENIYIYSVSKYADDAMKTFRPKYKSDLLFYGLQDNGTEELVPISKIKGAEGKKVFVSVGTVIHRKGQDILTEAIRLLPDSARKQCFFLFVGKCIDHNIFKYIKDLERDYPEEVRQIDAVPHEEIFDLYRQATAVICSSRDDPLPTFMAETMMVSGVCICSENTGTASVIRHGENGFLYEKDNPRKLAKCIRMAAESDNLDSIKAESRKTFEQYFTLEIFRKNLMKCVEDCISHNAQGEYK